MTRTRLLTFASVLFVVLYARPVYAARTLPLSRDAVPVAPPSATPAASSTAVTHPLTSPLGCIGPQHNTIPFHGTINVHSGIPQDCVVQILGGAILHAGGGTAPQIPNVRTRAVFRVTGAGRDGLDAPGGVTIVVGAAPNLSNAPELDNLSQPATLTLAAGTVLVRWDFATNSFVPVPDGRIQQALVAYKILRRGAPPLPQPVPPAAPSTLPATGSGPLRAAPLVAGLLLLLRGGRGRAQAGKRRWRLIAPVIGGVLLVAALGVYGVMARRTAAVGFGALAGAFGPTPRTGGALGPPTRLVVPSVGIDTTTQALGVTNGAWQAPSYGAAYLTGTAWPGHAGTEAITGHDDADGAVFRRLGDLRAGAEALVYAGARVYRYRVIALRVVAPTAVEVLRPTRGATLTLITCAPYLVDTERLVVRAELIR